ncbi:MAG TPA: hypothetical protein VHY08_13185 [Bacillota bacterium]|nr:hypothetical protein [Bacillota bacterium]
MPVKNRQELYDKFVTGNKPTQDDFIDLIDSMINISEDGIGASQKGKPMEIIQQGTAKRLLDFSSSIDTPMWRISALSVDNNRNGLNFSSNNQNRLFLRQETGNIGINTDNPLAKLHIIPEAGLALRIDNQLKTAMVMVDGNGNVGIGTDPQNSYNLTVGGAVDFKEVVISEKLLTANAGITVENSQILAKKGITIRDKAIVETLLEANNGVTVKTKPLNAEAGAIITGEALNAQHGLIVDGGVDIKSGSFLAESGLTVSGTGLNVSGGLNVNCTATLNGNVTIEKGFSLTAKGGVSVVGSTFSANKQVFLGAAEDGEVTVNGSLKAANGLEVDGDILKVRHGMTVYDGDTTINGQLILSQELSLSTNFTASGIVVLGNESTGTVTVEGALQATKGITITGSELRVQNGLTVNNIKATFNSSLTANNGLSVINSPLTANGTVNLGSPSKDGKVTVNGAFDAVNGATIRGGKLLAQNGLEVTGKFDAPNDSTMRNVTITNLDVTNELKITGSLELQSLDLKTVTADDAQIGTMITEGQLTIGGKCYVRNDIVLADGKLYASFEGPSGIIPTLQVQRGNVGYYGHFKIEVNSYKIIVTYDDLSDINNFLSDWDVYKKANPGPASGFNFSRIGTGPWKIKDLSTKLVSSGTILKEFRIANNGIRVMYTGSQAGPKFELIPNEVTSETKFSFTISDLKLTIRYPGSSEQRTAKNLLRDWAEWKSSNGKVAEYFEIQQTGDKNWLIKDITQELNSTGEEIRSCTFGGLAITNQSDSSNAPKVIIKAATPSSDTGITISVSNSNLEITLGQTENTLQAVYNAWKQFEDSGKNTYGFDIEANTSASTITISQEVSLLIEDDTHSKIDISGISITYEGNNPGNAKVKFQPGSDADNFAITVDESGQLVTVNYPVTANARTVSNLLSVWGTVNKYGFEISQIGSDISIQQEQAITQVTSNVSQYETTTNGVDKITVKYVGPPADKPKLVIVANTGAEANQFNIDIAADKTMTIKYPADKKGTVDALLSYWGTYANKGNFTITKYDITGALAPANNDDVISNDLTANPDNNLFSKAIIRTNRVTVDGSLLFGDSDIEINSISNSNTLAEDSDSILVTQKAIKAYVKGLISKDAVSGNSQTLATTQSAVKTYVEGLISKDAVSGNSETIAPTQSAVKTYVEGLISKDAVSGNSETIATTQSAVKTYVEGLISKDAVSGNSETIAPTQSAVKTYVDGLISNTSIASNNSNKLAPTQRAVKTYVEAQISKDAVSGNSETLVPTQSAVKTYVEGLISKDAVSGNSETLVPTQSAVKTYVEGFISKDAVSGNSEALVPTQSAVKTYVEGLISKDAVSGNSETLVPTQSAVKSYVDGELALKAGSQKLASFPVPSKASQNVTTISLAADSRGLLMALVKKDDGLILGMGLFAVHHPDIVSKLAGDKFGDAANPSVYNIFYTNSKLTVQNTTADNITVMVTYFGA